ncbi:ribonuclease H-like domain-containing protein [Tanacetum coccineum]
MVNVIAVIKKTDGPLTPSATKLLKIAMDRANNCTVAFNGGEEYEVKGQSGSQCVVNVVKKVCSCRKWELTGIPCSHAIAANYNMSLNEVQVGITKNRLVMWKKSQIPTTLTPPKHNTPVGRPRKNKRKSKEEKAKMVKDGKLSRAYKTVTCMKCGNLRAQSRYRKRPYDALHLNCSCQDESCNKEKSVHRLIVSFELETPQLPPSSGAKYPSKVIQLDTQQVKH